MRHRRRFISLTGIVLFMVLMAAFFCGAALAEVKKSQGQTVYLPIYSHIYSGNKERPMDLAVTVSVRNTSPDLPITLVSAKYFDSDGKLLNNYVDKPITLDALASIRYVIKESDRRGGAGAKFIVVWRSETPLTPPLIEAVMISTRMNQGISFLSRGLVIEE